MVDTGWLSDNAGRIANISLASNTKNALFPLFEAVMNSIHAIEERFGRDNLSAGRVHITIHQDASGEFSGFTVEDNGAGFTSENITSLRKFDSRKKAKIGGKGVGRLLWLKVCDAALIESTYLGQGKLESCSFHFTIDNPIDKFETSSARRAEPMTSVTINPYKSEFAVRLPKKLETFANRLIAHFVSYFTNMSHPEIVLQSDQGERLDLFDAFSSKVERDRDYEFIVEGVEAPFVLHCFLLPKTVSDDEKSVNAIYMGANGRAVTRHELDSVLGMKAVNGSSAFLGYIESDFLNANANDTRTAFSLDDEQVTTIIDVAKALAKDFLAPEIAKIREKQASRIIEIGREHPRFFYAARHAAEVASDLHLSKQTEEEIFVELSRSSLRDYKKRKKNYAESFGSGLPDVVQQTEHFMQKLKEDAMSSLAEYVARRKSILEIFEAALRFSDIEDETSHYEKVVHGVICPLNSTSEELSYEDHNLWLLDDRLAFYTYFNSDRKMSKQAIASDPLSKDRPDISLFDLGLGFKSDDPTQPITIIEFKRPKRDNYTLADNPISQVRSYVEQLRAAEKAVKFDGTPLRDIGPDTPFTCHIVADLTPSLRTVMKQLGQFSRRAGSSSYYWWDPNYRTFIEISDFHEVLTSAKARNFAFFNKLGID